MKILSIGNSFSQDAQRYLHRIAKADGYVLDTFNLCIGGCSLESHYNNMLSEDKAYALEKNGESTGEKVSLKEMLSEFSWDIITLQQVSHLAPDYNTYQPYLCELVKYVKKYQPGARIAIHQTWAYEQDSERLNVELGYSNYADMLEEVKASYNKAVKDVNPDLLIPSGELFGKLVEACSEKIHRDTFHASRGIGRYALGLLWYRALTGNDIKNNGFSEFDEEISAENIQIVKKTVDEVL